MPVSFLGTFQLFVASQSLLVSVLLSRRRRSTSTGGTALGTLLALLGVHLGIEAAQRLGWLAPGVTAIDLFGLLYGPLFLLFVRDLTFRRTSRRPFGVGHLAPFVLGLATLPWDALPPEIYAVAVWISLSFYLTMSLRVLARYRAVVASTRSDADRVALGWLRYSIFGLLGVLVLDVVSSLFERPFRSTDLDLLPWILFGFLLLYIYGFAVGAVHHGQLFAGVSETDEDLLDAATAVLGREDEIQADAGVLESLEDRMLDRRLHLEPQLTITELAQQLGVPPRRLSELVNGLRGRNFSDWINGWRIEEAKRLLISDPERSVLDVLLDAGFHSKSTFNAVFKEKTGMTPTEYRRLAKRD